MTQESTPDRDAERSLGRRNLLKGAAALGLGTISGRGIYETLGDIVRPTPAQAATVVRRMQEQYLIRQLEVIVDNGQTVVIPPIFNDVFTAKLSSKVTWTTAALKNAKTRVENALAKVEAPYPDTAAGLTIVVGWGLPYFRLSAAMQALGNKYLPAVPNTGRQQLAVIDAIRFPSDPGYDPNDGQTPIALEDNHVMFKFRSDSQTILRTVESQLFENAKSGAYIGDLFDLTSKRMGFAGRGFGVLSQGKTLAAAAQPPRGSQHSRPRTADDGLHEHPDPGPRARTTSSASRRSREPPTSGRRGTSPPAARCISRTCTSTSTTGTAARGRMRSACNRCSARGPQRLPQRGPSPSPTGRRTSPASTR